MAIGALPVIWSTNNAPLSVLSEADLAGLLVVQFQTGTICTVNNPGSGIAPTSWVWIQGLAAGTVAGVSVQVGTAGSWLAFEIGALAAGDINTVVGAAGTQSLQRIIPASPIAVNVKGYTTPGDGGGGPFYWDATNVAIDDSGTIIRPIGILVGAWVRIYSAPLNVRWFGAFGNGIHDDTTSIAATYAVVPSGGEMYIPKGQYRFTSKLTFARSVSIVGDGTSSCLFPDFSGANIGTDAVFLNGGNAGLNGLTFKDFSILGTAGANAGNTRHGFFIRAIHRSVFLNVHVRTGGSGDEYRLEGCLIDDFINPVVSVNVTYPYTVASVTTIGFSFHIGPIFNLIATNACRIENPAFEGGAPSLFVQDDQTAGNGYNTIDGGAIEGCAGRAITVTGATDFEARNVDVEATTGIIFTSCLQGIRLANIVGFSGSTSLSIDAVQATVCDCVMDGVIVAGGETEFTGGHATSITDSGGRAYMKGRIESFTLVAGYRNGIGLPHHTSSGRALDATGDFARWQPTFPDLFTLLAGATATHTGVGLADTTRHLLPDACKVTTGGAANSGIRYTIPITTTGANGLQIPVGGEWVSAGIWINVPMAAAGSSVKFRGKLDQYVFSNRNGSFVANSSPPDTWIFLTFSIFVDPSKADTLGIDITCDDAISFYIAELEVTLGKGTSPRRAYQANVGPNLFFGGQRVTYGSAAPTGGIWREIGDLHINTAPAVGSPISWSCTASGTPGTWKANFFAETMLWGAQQLIVVAAANSLYPGYSETTATGTALQYTAVRPGVARNFHVHQEATGAHNVDITYTLRKNNVDTAVTVTIADNATDGSDLTHAATFAIGDFINVSATPSANGPASPQHIVVTFEYDG